MTKKELTALQTGTIVFIVRNLGSYGIFKYQYIGIIKNVFDKREYHLFLGEYFSSTVCIQMGAENRSSQMASIFTIEADAIQRQAQLRLAEQEAENEDDE